MAGRPNWKRDALTTGQLADVFGVAPRTVSKWADKCGLKFHRLPRVGAAAGERRFNAADVAAWCREQRMPVPGKLREVLGEVDATAAG